MKQNLRRTGIVLLAVVMLCAGVMTACGQPKEEFVAPIKIAALNGPTGMGMVPLMGEKEKYEIETFQAPDELLAKVIKGEVEIAAVPSNVASVLYNKTKGNVRAFAIQTAGILYLVQNESGDPAELLKDVADLKGKTIYASGQGAMPEYVLRQILTNAGLDPDQDITIQWMASHSDVMSTLMTNTGAIAMLPEPFVTTALAKKDTLSVGIDLNELWKESYGGELPMGVLIAQKSFIEERDADLQVFMKDMTAAAEAVNSNPEEASKLMVKNGIGNDEAIMESAIPRCNLCFLTGKDLKASLDNLYAVLAEAQPASIGGKLPDEGFYY